jgi:hypothetical protein
MIDQFYIEVRSYQKNHEGELICGDVFLKKLIKEENRIIAVLSDGMGHGVKANILATLTATMALNFTKEHKDFKRIAETIMKTLPVCSIRQISYSTFSIIDIEIDGEIRILEYDNPGCVIYRNHEEYDPGWSQIVLDTDEHKGKLLRTCSYYPEIEDRVIFWTDGIVQSGLGTTTYPFGWERENAVDFAKTIIKNQPNISAQRLCTKIVNKAFSNDNFHAKDDTTCVGLYFRNPRTLLVCSGPPYDESHDKNYAQAVREFAGRKVLCGATTADIISRELNIEVRDDLIEITDDELPPISHMEGIDLVTEGILTLGRVSEILDRYDNTHPLGTGPADQIVKLIRQSDKIHFIVGTRINIAHQDPSLPVELEIRRTVIKRIVNTLENKYLKEVSMEYI